jgi:RNA polymerase sigma factor (sigma-70 family)
VPQRPSPYTVEFYEGLVRKTAGMTFPLVEDEYEDIVQILRLKCWRALESYDPARATQTVQGYVFMCVRNQVKDLIKKKRRDELYIEDQRAGGDDHFDGLYLIDEEPYDAIEAELPLIPSTLTALERGVLALLYEGYKQREVALRLGVPRGEVERAVKAIRSKMGDWRPSGAETPRSVAD